MNDWLRILRSPDGDGGNGEAAGADPDAGSKTGDEGGENAAGSGSQEAKFTQADVDRMIEKRQARDRRNWEKELEEKSKQAAMTEAERLKAEKDDVLKKSSDRISKADRRSLESDAKLALHGAGVKAERVKAALKLLDLAGIDIDPDEGTYDETELQAIVATFVKDYPELVGATGAPAAGQNFGEAPKSEPPITSQGQIDKMDKAERTRRWPDILAFYAKQKAKQ
jgi:hypothetical protein